MLIDHKSDLEMQLTPSDLYLIKVYLQVLLMNTEA